ncbi:MAG: glycosyltransferase family 9 protein [Anaerolineae bacterium]
MHYSQAVLPGIRKIAVLRATNLGDYIAATPALNALRRTYPQAEMVYLGRLFHKTLLESRPNAVDRVVVVPVSHGVRTEQYMPHLKEDPAELDAFFQQMHTEQFDLAIQLHGGGRNSNPFLKRLGAAFNVGTRTPDAIALDRWMPYVLAQNEPFRWAELVRLVGANADSVEPSIPVTAADRAAFHTALPMLAAPFIVLHPGASDMRRRWPPERFARVGDALAQAGYTVVITGIEEERDVIEQVVAQMQRPAINTCNQLTLGALIGLIEAAALVVSNDTGTMHLANAVQTPNVGIFWCFNYLNWSHLGRSLHRPLPSWTVTCPLCGADIMRIGVEHPTCQHETCLVTGVTVEEVLTQAFDLLAYTTHHMPL